LFIQPLEQWNMVNVTTMKGTFRDASTWIGENAAERILGLFGLEHEV
jgi:hypothetical protein